MAVVRVVVPVMPRDLWLPPHMEGVGVAEAGAGGGAYGLKLREKIGFG